MTASRFDLRFHQERCTGCLRCALTCSDLHAGSFCPGHAYVRVDEAPGGVYAIRFEEACDRCGACAESCFYDALSKVRREVDP